MAPRDLQAPVYRDFQPRWIAELEFYEDAIRHLLDDKGLSTHISKLTNKVQSCESIVSNWSSIHPVNASIRLELLRSGRTMDEIIAAIQHDFGCAKLTKLNVLLYLRHRRSKLRAEDKENVTKLLPKVAKLAKHTSSLRFVVLIWHLDERMVGLVKLTKGLPEVLGLPLVFFEIRNQIMSFGNNVHILGRVVTTLGHERDEQIETELCHSWGTLTLLTHTLEALPSAKQASLQTTTGDRMVVEDLQNKLAAHTSRLRLQLEAHES